MDTGVQLVLRTSQMRAEGKDAQGTKMKQREEERSGATG